MIIDLIADLQDLGPATATLAASQTENVTGPNRTGPNRFGKQDFAKVSQVVKHTSVSHKHLVAQTSRPTHKHL